MLGGRREGSQRLVRGTRRREISGKSRPAARAGREDRERRARGVPAPHPPRPARGFLPQGSSLPTHVAALQAPAVPCPGAPSGPPGGSAPGGGGTGRRQAVHRPPPARASQLLTERVWEPLGPVRATPRAPPSFRSPQS